MNNSFVRKYLPIDPTDRDKTSQYQAYEDFVTLVGRFPRSKYTSDARQRMIFLRNMFARAELNVAKFYMRRHAFVAAANRASFIVQHYQQSPEAGEALGMMVVAYDKLNLVQAKMNAMHVLRINYKANTVKHVIDEANALSTEA